MKLESLVIVDQHATVNLYLGLVLPARHAPEIEWVGNYFSPSRRVVEKTLEKRKENSSKREEG